MALVAIAGLAAARSLHAAPVVTFVVIFVATASHGFLDAATDGGLGVAFFSPFSNERYFLPWRPISVSPLSQSRFLSERGLNVLASEAQWIWLPSLAAALLARAARARRNTHRVM